MIKPLNPAHVTTYPSVTKTIGKAAEAWTENKYAKAAKEIAGLDLTPPPLTGPPHRAQGLQGGFIDVSV